MTVDLDAVEMLLGESALDELLRAGFSREDGAAGDHLGIRARELQREFIEGCGHPGLVHVREDHASLDSACPEGGKRLVDADPVLDGPGMLAEPSPDRLRQPVRKEMHVRIDDHPGPPFQFDVSAFDP